MSFLPRLHHELTDALRERNLAQLHKNLRGATAQLIESRGRSQEFRDRLDRTRSDLRNQIRSASTPSKSRDDLGPPVSLDTLRARGTTPAAPASVQHEAASGTPAWPLAGAIIVAVAMAAAVWHANSGDDGSSRARAEEMRLHPRVAAHGVGLR